MPDPLDLTLAQSGALFAICAAVVWFAGARLVYLVDALSDRFALAKSLAGLLFLAFSTSLPEIATTLGAAVQANAELVLNNLFGGIALQTAILATADLWARGAITNYPRKANHALEATLLVLLMALLLATLSMQEPVSFAHVGLGSIAIACIYAGAIWLLRWYDGANDWIPVDLPEEEDGLLRGAASSAHDSSTAVIIWQTALSITLIFAFGLGLVTAAEGIARGSGLGSSFIGVTLLAAATSLPELTTTIAAIRLGAYTMAISNVFGSNLIMVVLVLPADILYLPGPILRGTSATVTLALAFGAAVTAVYIVGLIVRRKPRLGPLGLDSLIVLGLYLLSLVAYFHMR